MALLSVPADERLNPDHPHHEPSTIYSESLAAQGLPRFELGGDEMPGRDVAQYIKDELLSDGQPALNLATFVSTSMEPEALELMSSTMNINFIDTEEYQGTAEIEKRCVNIIARLFNAPIHSAEEEAMGVSTIGSSEAIILSVLAAKRRWQNERKAAGLSTENPNMIMSSAVQVCVEKAARYLDIEERYVNITDKRFVMDPAQAISLVDDHTILIVAILGSTYTGHYEDVEKLNELLTEDNEKHGRNVHIHVDAASGGFVAPFNRPDLKWDFRLSLVGSISVSGHKYGGSLAGVGWCIFRSKKMLPDSVLFTVNYLGAPQVSFTLNFSKSATSVIGQYYMLLRWGRAGYERVMTTLSSTADHLSSAIEAMKGKDGKMLFTILSETGGKGLPLVAWKLKEAGDYDEFAIARQLRQSGWIVPAYTLAPSAEHVKLLRVVVRNDFSRSRSEIFIRDLSEAINYLESLPKVVAKHLSAHATHPVHHKVKSHHYMAKQVDDSHSLQGKSGKTHAVC